MNPADQSIFFIVLRSSTLSLAVLDEIAQTQVAQRISMVSGVAQVNIFGSQKFAVRVDVDPRELAARSIGIDEVAAINSANSNLPTGTIYGERTFVVRSNGQLMRRPPMGRRSSPIAMACPFGWTKWRMSTTGSKTTKRRAGRTVNAASTCRCRSSPV